MTSLTLFKRWILALTGCGLLSAGAHAVVFQAEDYANAYDTTAGNTGGAYRNDSVDIEGTADGGGGYNVGWIDANEWLAFNGLNIPSSGNYTIRMRVASPSGGTASVDLNGGAIVLGDFNVGASGGWQNWTTVSKTVHINAGNYSLGVFAKTGGWNFNWIEVVSAGGGGGSGLVTVYQHCNYTGWSAGIGQGQHNLNALWPTGFVNDDASSIRVTAGYEAVVFEHDNFGGASTVIRGDTGCLVNIGYNDRVSSIIVRPAGGGGTGFAAVVSESQFNQMFPNRNPFYTYSGLVQAAQTYPDFAGVGDINARKREAAAALANFSHETGRFVHVTEIAQGLYCGDWDNNPSTCPCEPGKRYYGRGPVQLSWNGNYCAAGAALGYDLRRNPEMVEQNSKIAWQTSLWFWMTQAGAGYWPAHTVMVNNYGFGETIRTINGSVECDGKRPDQVQSRINEYNRILGILGTTAGGGNMGC